MTAAELTLHLPIWLPFAFLTPAAFWAGYPLYIRPHVVHWRKRRRNARRLGI